MADFAKAAKEVFQILNTYNYTVSLFDKDSNHVAEPEEARRFYSKNRNLMVSIEDDDDDSCIELRYGKSTHASEIQGLNDALREAATKYALTYRSGRFEKNIEPKDETDLASVTERKQVKMTISSLTEGMYGTTRSSYLKMENARMIVRHSKRIDDSLIGARGRCVEQIFIENVSGERLLFPSTQIAPARAMTQHVNQGGTFADEVGGQIMRMTSDYANLGQASVFINNNAGALQEGAMQVREACRARMRECRKTFARLSKASSYQKESAKMQEKAKMLAECGEEEIDETRISEIRQLLNDADLPRSVYECACKAVDKMKETTPMVEDTAIRATVGVLGRRVNKEAWDNLKDGKLELTGQPESIDYAEFRSPYDKLCAQLGSIIPKMKDESLANLLDHVVSGIRQYTGSDAEVAPVRAKDRMDDWKKALKDMIAIAKAVVKIANINVQPAIAENMAPIREHMAWLDRFNPDRVLTEYFLDPYSTINGRDTEDVYNDSMDRAIDDFDADDFVNSEEMDDVIDGRNPQDPEENTLTHKEVMDALKDYLARYIEMYSSDFDDGFNGDLTSVAEELYDQTCEALQKKGFVVEHKHNEEDADPENLDEFAMSGHDDDENDLTPGDIMLPTGNQANSLIKGVSKVMVKDPDSKGMRKPDSAYIDRIQSLGWVTAGPDSQSY